MDQHAPLGVEAHEGNTNRADILTRREMLHPGVHGPAEIVVVARDGHIVEVNDHRVQALGGLDKIVPDILGSMNRLQGVIEIGVWSVNLGGILPGCLFIKTPQELLKT